jgi:endoglycosylceramidase
VIFVPALQYPNGYRISVSGGRVVAGRGTSRLSIAADAGAATVSVTLRRK